MSLEGKRAFIKTDANGHEIQSSSSDMTIRMSYSGTNLEYLGEARIGSGEGSTVWKLIKFTNDGTNITGNRWPKNSDGVVSSEYEFSWTSRATYTYV